MVIESLTFGQSVLVYRQLTMENKEIIAKTYGLNKIFIESWFYAFLTFAISVPIMEGCGIEK
jgi:abortive infection bacteriophage resistance protein